MTSSAAAQGGGSTGSAIAGGALGLYSAAMLGWAGSIVPCGQTYAGPRCARWTAIASGAIGLASGIALGSADEQGVSAAYEGAGYGMLAGVTVGFVLKEVVPHYGWLDVAAAGGVGAAMGAAAKGATIGFLSGAAVGAALYFAVPSFNMADAIGAGLVGMAVGGLVQWIARAVNADGEFASSSALVIPFRIGIP